MDAVENNTAPGDVGTTLFQHTTQKIIMIKGKPMDKPPEQMDADVQGVAAAAEASTEPGPSFTQTTLVLDPPAPQPTLPDESSVPTSKKPNAHENNTPSKQGSVKTTPIKAEAQIKGENMYTCEICDARFARQDLLESHAILHYNSKTVTCGVCKVKFSKECELQEHERFDPRKNSFACCRCRKRFIHREDLRKHAEIHIKRINQKMKAKRNRSIADSFPSNLDQIMKKYSDKLQEEKHPYLCKLCDLRIASLRSLKLHMASHSSEKPFVCTTCEAVFRTKNLLTVHKHLHEGKDPDPQYFSERPVVCQLCKCRFPNQFQLKTHGKQHELELPNLNVSEESETDPNLFGCFAGKRATPKTRIAADESLVANAPQREVRNTGFACAVCTTTTIFSSTDRLAQHMSIHGSASPFLCPICSSSFDTQAALGDHMFAYHVENKVYLCSICCSEFETHSHLSAHMRNNHSA